LKIPIRPRSGRFFDAPKIVVAQVLGGRLLEGEHLTSLWVHSRHDVANGTVFPGSIHGLKDQEYGPGVLGIQFLLHVTEALNVPVEISLGVWL
jgi:hypothetical protein